MMNTVKEKWPEIIEHLRVEHELSNVSFNTWIQPLKVYDVVDNTVFILVNMNASVEYIEKKYQFQQNETVNLSEFLPQVLTGFLHKLKHKLPVCSV